MSQIFDILHENYSGYLSYVPSYIITSLFFVRLHAIQNLNIFYGCIAVNGYFITNLAKNMLGFTKSFQTIKQKSKLVLKYFKISAILKEVIDKLFLNVFGNH